MNDADDIPFVASPSCVPTGERVERSPEPERNVTMVYGVPLLFLQHKPTFYRVTSMILPARYTKRKGSWTEESVFTFPGTTNSISRYMRVP
jgi:hypothetical protein